MEFFSKYTSEESVRDFRNDVILSGSGREEDVVIDPVGSKELVTGVRLRAFELVCLGLDLEPRLGVFFHFYQIKSLFPGKQVSISSQPNRGLFSLYASNFKNYKDTFFCVRCGPRLPDLMYNAVGSPLFPFYWTQDPQLVKGVDEALLTPYESEVISFLNTFLLFEIKELLALETDHPSLVLYLRESLPSFSI
jgi:hypothetical protein